MSPMWNETTKAKRIIPVVAFPVSREDLSIKLDPTAWTSGRGTEPDKRCAKENATVPEAVNASCLVVALPMVIAPQLTACWGLTALKYGMGGDRSDASPTSNVLYTCRAATFLCVHPFTAWGMQRAQKCTLGCTPSTP